MQDPRLTATTQADSTLHRGRVFHNGVARREAVIVVNAGFGVLVETPIETQSMYAGDVTRAKPNEHKKTTDRKKSLSDPSLGP